MPDEHSFDIVSIVDIQEVSNAVNQATKEIRQRFDFKDSRRDIIFEREEGRITLISDDEQKLKSVIDILQSKLIKRGISLKALEYGKLEPSSGDTVRQIVKIRQGVGQDKAKEIVKFIKDLKLKVTPEIQKDQIRVRGKKIDDLQEIIKRLKERDFGIPLQFVNYR